MFSVGPMPNTRIHKDRGRLLVKYQRWIIQVSVTMYVLRSLIWYSFYGGHYVERMFPVKVQLICPIQSQF